MAKIDSGSAFLLRFLWHLLLLPFMLILAVFGRKTFDDVLRPFYDIWEFIFQPKFTVWIIGINWIAFVISLFLTESQFLSLVHHPSDLLTGQYYTIISAGFLHGNLGHIFGNSIGIYIFGRVVERELDSLKTALIYFGALIISMLFSSGIYILQGQNLGGVGASGALMGLVAAAVLLNPFYITYELLIPLPVMVVGWLTLWADISGVLSGVDDGIGHFAHLGGFFSITILLFLLSPTDRRKLHRGLMINIFSVIVAGVGWFYFFA